MGRSSSVRKPQGENKGNRRQGTQSVEKGKGKKTRMGLRYSGTEGTDGGTVAGSVREDVTLGIFLPGVTCQVMHQVFNEVSHYGVSRPYYQHHPD